MVTSYRFGDTDLAAERLRVLDAAFAPTSDTLLAELAAAPGHVLDLGCGPGSTTARLVARFPDATVTGIDASDAFLRAARAAVPTAAFTSGDVTRPLLDAPYDLIYARFLLAHLAEVRATIAGWLDALGPDGLLLLEETEHIGTTDEWFARYERLAGARVAAGGADVYAGPGIAAAIPSVAGEVVVDRVLEIDLTAGQAAGMFWRNLATWGADAVDEGLITEPDRAALLDHLRARESDPARGLFAWTHRQTVLRRT